MEEVIEDKRDMGETIANAVSAGETAANMENAIDVEGDKKDYKNTFYALFVAGILENVLYYYNEAAGLSLNVILFFIEFVIIVLWCKTFNETWKLIGKKNGWLWGLIVLVPYGVIIGLLVAERTLSKAGYWKGGGSFKLSK